MALVVEDAEAPLVAFTPLEPEEPEVALAVELAFAPEDPEVPFVPLEPLVAD